MPARSQTDLFESSRSIPPARYLIAHIDGGARGNPGPAGYGVVLEDESGKKVATLSEYLGRQTNNFAEYQGLIGALEYAIQRGPKSLKVISDSELLVRQIKGIYKVKNATLKDLYARAKELIAELDWFSISHALREHNHEADRLANEAMDTGTGRASTTERVARALASTSSGQAMPAKPHPSTGIEGQEFEGRVRGGTIELLTGTLPEGTRVQVRVKK